MIYLLIEILIIITSIIYYVLSQHYKSCPHNLTKHKIYAKCCQRYYECKRCHSDKCQKELIIDHIKCISCGTEQKCSEKCVKCEIRFADYYCSICEKWSSSEMTISHCKKCNTCLESKYGLFHCDACNICVPIKSKETHKCYGMNECVICMEKIDLTSVNSHLNCGHILHSKCYMEYIEKCCNSLIFICPICKKTGFAKEITTSILDKSVSKFHTGRSIHNQFEKIKCNDCSLDSKTIYHPIYHKCGHCSSYNTRLDD